MSVIVRPATAANERGMRNLPLFQPFSWAKDLKSGLSSAITGVLWMNPLKVAVMSELFMRTPRELFPNRSMIRWKGSVSFLKRRSGL
jgi:hypothetical protein